MGLAAFLVVIQLLITAVHWIIFRSVDHYFDLTGATEYYVFWLFLLSSLTFLLSNIATRIIPSRVSRLAYRLATIWLGTIHFLFLGAVVMALLELSSDFLLLTTPSWVAYGVYLGAILISYLSLRHAKQIFVRRHTVALPNLPSRWRGKRALFFADTHYGSIHRAKAAERLVNLIESEEPDLILMGGDFFDGPPIDPDLVTFPYRRLTQTIPTFFISGNHEEYGKKAEFLRSLETNGFRIINDEKVVLDGLQIVGLDFMTTRTEAATAMTLKHLELDRTLPTIILKHIPRHMEMIEMSGGHLMLSGHTHQGQVWPVSLITHFVYSGYDYGLKPYKNLQVYTTSGAGSWGPPQRFLTQSEVVVFTLENKE